MSEKSSSQPRRRDPIVRFEATDIVFGRRPADAFPLIDQGASRAEIAASTGQLVAVRGVTLTVREGEILVLMGLSGSGKSSLLRAVNGLNLPARGHVWMRDGDEEICVGTASRQQLRALRRTRVAMVFQQFGLLPWRTVAQNVGLGLELAGRPKRQRQREIEEQLRRVSLDGWIDKRVDELSGGMQQRVGLARALATHAPILLMDEPYSALDPLIRQRLQDELLELQAAMHRTIIFVSHDLDEAMRIGDRIAIMEEGRIVQVGTPREIALAPATDYVAAFVGKANLMEVLRARDVMRKPDPAMTVSRSVSIDATIGDIVRRRSTGETLAVVDGGQVVGVVTSDDLLSGLNRSPHEAAK